MTTIVVEAPFNVSERAKGLGVTIGHAIDRELSHPITGWIAPYVRTAVCDGIAHEYRRVLEVLKAHPECLDKVKILEAEAHRQRFTG